jgi:hypothetical protein
MLSYQRIIAKKDIVEAISFIDSQSVAWHNARLNTVYLEKDQKKMLAYT